MKSDKHRRWQSWLGGQRSVLKPSFIHVNPSRFLLTLGHLSPRLWLFLSIFLELKLKLIPSCLFYLLKSQTKVSRQITEFVIKNLNFSGIFHRMKSPRYVRWDEVPLPNLQGTNQSINYPIEAASDAWNDLPYGFMNIGLRCLKYSETCKIRQQALIRKGVRNNNIWLLLPRFHSFSFL